MILRRDERIRTYVIDVCLPSFFVGNHFFIRIKLSQEALVLDDCPRESIVPPLSPL